MTKSIQGVIHGRTIELSEDAGLCDGQSVHVQLTPVAIPQTTPNRLIQSAGLLAKEWTPDDDRILEEIHQDRKHDTRPEL